MSVPVTILGEVYCPKCGSAMTGFVCPEAGDWLSGDMQAQLRERFVTPGTGPSSPPLPFRFGGVWFCPADGSELQEQDGMVACPECGRDLNRFVYTLTEQHVHMRIPEEGRP